MSWISLIVGVIVLIIAVISLVDMFRSHLSSGRTAAWAIIIVLLPLLGAILYWSLRSPTQRELGEHMDAQAEVRRSGGERPAGRPGVW